MDKATPAEYFSREWICYLEQHGHHVGQGSAGPDVLVSRNGRGRGYRWLLRCTDADSILLTDADRKEMRRQIRLARNARQQCFVATKFGHPGGKALVMPAVEATAARRIRSDRGSVPWEC